MIYGLIHGLINLFDELKIYFIIITQVYVHLSLGRNVSFTVSHTVVKKKPSFFLFLILISSSLSGCTSTNLLDTDDDGIDDSLDNCVFLINPNQIDTNSDGEGDTCDDDDDGDLTLDLDDKFPLDHTEISDMDNDGIGDNSDLDRDGDGVDNLQDHFPNDFFEQRDTDLDGLGNNADDDDDDDGLLDIVDPFDLTPFTSLNNSGPFNVGTTELIFNSPRGHEITLQLWYPTVDEKGEYAIYDDAWYGNAWESAEPDCSESRPVVAYSHGLPSIRWASSYYMEYLASHGFFAFAPDHRFSTLLDLQLENFAEMMLSRPVDIMESFDWLSSKSEDPGYLNGCVDYKDGYAMTGQSTGGFTSLMISGAEILLSDLQDDCKNPHSGGIDEINPGSSCEMIELWQIQNPNSTVIKIQDSRAWATVLLAPWNGSLLDNGISSTDSNILLIASDIDETVPLYEVNNTRNLLSDNVLHSALLIDAGHYHYAPIGCAVRGCVGNLSIDEATDFTNISILIFLAQMLQWPGANDYQMPDREFVEWRV